MEKRKRWLSLGVFFLLTVILVTVFITRCAIKAPLAPNWDVPLFIPLINETYTMVDLSEDINEISTSDQSVFLNYTYTFSPLSIEDQLSAPGAGTTLSARTEGSISDSLGIPLDRILLESATIKTGSMTLTVNNTYGYTFNITLQVTDLDSAQTAFIIDESVPPGTQVFGPYPLAGHVFTPPIRSGQNYIRFNGGLTGGSASDFVDVTLDFSDFTLSSVTGILNGIDISIDSVDQTIDIPDELNGLQVGDANAFLTFGPDVPFPMDVDILIEAVELAGGTTTETILIQQTLVPGVSDTIQVPNVADFFNSIVSQPSQIIITGDVSIGDGVTLSTISEDDSLTGEAILQAPLIFTLPAYDTNSGAPDTLEIKEDMQDVFQNNIKNLRLTGEIENHLPVGVAVEILFSNDTGDSATFYDPAFTPDFTRTIDIAAAPNDGQNPAHVTSSMTTPLNITMSEQDIDSLFADSLLYYGIRFDFPGTAGEMVEIRASDYIRIQANFTAEVNTTIPEDDDGEGGGS
ncbi:hypothetical protein ACFL6A_02210 [bacterium]